MSDEEKDIERLLKMRILGEDVLVEWEFARDEYAGTNILRLEDAKRWQYTGVVISVGPKVKDVKPGDRVLFEQYCRPETYVFSKRRFAQILEKDCMMIIPERTVVA